MIQVRIEKKLIIMTCLPWELLFLGGEQEHEYLALQHHHGPHTSRVAHFLFFHSFIYSSCLYSLYLFIYSLFHAFIYFIFSKSFLHFFRYSFILFFIFLFHFFNVFIHLNIYLFKFSCTFINSSLSVSIH